MAKVMISIPNGLLERIDDYAGSLGESRSGFLRRVAESELERNSARRRKEFEDLLGPPVDLGGDSARLIREDRDSH